MIAFSQLNEETTPTEWPAILKSCDVNHLFKAKNQAYQFDVLEENWQLSLKQFVRLEKITNSNKTAIDLLMFRLALARQATKLSPNTINMRSSALKNIRFSRNDPLVFQESFRKLSRGRQVNSYLFFKYIQKDDHPRFRFLKDAFTDALEFMNKIELPEGKSRGSNIFDPVKGMYSEAEELEINTKLRIDINETLMQQRTEECVNGVMHNRLGSLIAVTLMKSIFRRPTQLRSLKWIDVLPVGMSFADHRKTDQKERPEIEHLFSDVDQLHIRTFRGKDGEFRYLAEPRTHRIEPDFSNIILQYRALFQRRLETHLIKQGINLSRKAITALMLRLPLFPSQSLFETKFETKAKLFQSVGYRSESFHLVDKFFIGKIRRLSKSLNLTSERTLKELNLSNNRFRHTVLTNAAWSGMDKVALSSITGVTPVAVAPYLDLKFDSRLKIDTAFAEKQIFKQFGRVSVSELVKSEQIKVVNELGDESGVLLKGADCNTCESKLGRPIGCYGCDNFRPHLEGNHKAYLEKAERKLGINQDKGGSPLTIRKLERSILYIRATILICQEYWKIQRGIGNERD